MRTAAVVLLTLLIGFVAVRSAGVKALADSAPFAAARFWPSHPSVTIGTAMQGIARAAAKSESPPAHDLQVIALAARKAPLAPEPYLVHGISAQIAGERRLAEQAFRAAEFRAPREPAPRYLLAQHYLTEGRSVEGLREIAVLARLIPTGSVSLAPTLAAFAQSPGAIPQLRALFRTEPVLAQVVLAELAKRASNADLVLALAQPRPAGEEGIPTWALRLIHSLVADGQYAKAHRLWAATAGIETPAGSLYDPGFRGSSAPPPFNWSFESRGAGIAEPAGGGSLRVLYYGRENGVLARQLLLLRPGRYVLEFRVSGGGGSRESLGWSLICMPGRQPLLTLPLDRGQGDLVRAGFQVPERECEAQQLQLQGTSQDVVRQIDLSISELSLKRIAQ